MSDLVHFLNGKWGTEREIGWPIGSLGMSRGLTLFAYIRTVGDKLFMADAHIKSLLEGGESIGLVPNNKEELFLNAELAVRKNIDKLGPEMAVRVILTAGNDTNGTVQTAQPAMVAILATKLPVYEESLYKAGIKTKVVEGQRPLPELKHTFYMQSVLSPEDKVDEVILKTVDGDLLEASKANLFFVNQNDQVVTAESRIYQGVTRGIVIHLLESSSEQILKQPVNIAELGDMKEAFITNTSKGVMPVNSIDFKVFAGSGQKTQKIMSLYNDFVRNHS